MAKKTGCRLCNAGEVETFLSFGPTPLANAFLSKADLEHPEGRYPLDVGFCHSCGLVQLTEAVPPTTMFSEYRYLTGMSRTAAEHFGELAHSIIETFAPPKGSLVVDIGSNDGTLLRQFQGHGLTLLGIEPAANVAQRAQSHGTDTVNEFFGEATATRLRQDRGPAAVITATNVMAHVPDIHDFLCGVSALLAPEGVFVAEVAYLLDLVTRLEFDTIYHEHVSYFALQPLVQQLQPFGMAVVDAKPVDYQGGSLRVYIQRGPSQVSPNVERLLHRERNTRLDQFDTYQAFSHQVQRARIEHKTFLRSLKAKGATIAGYGAAAKGVSLLNYCDIGRDTIDYIVDNTPLKQGMYTPGTHIPIVPEEGFRRSPPDYALLLAWNYEQEILRKEASFLDKGGRFIIPIPSPRVVERRR